VLFDRQASARKTICDDTLYALCVCGVAVGLALAAASGLPQPALALNCVGGTSAAAIAKVLR
jgi:hypothetical protein